MLNVIEELAEASRRAILSELRSGPKNVSEIVAATKLKQPNVSNHLARMKSRGIVSAYKVGRQVYYGLASPETEAVVRNVCSTESVPVAEVDLEALTCRYAKSAVAGDEQACAEMLDTLFRANVPLLDLYQSFLAPAMARVGTWYQVEAIDEAQEHMASAITERMLSRAAQMMGPQRRSDRVAVLGCPPNNWHVIGLRMVGDYLRLNGWQTYFLGANVPVSAFLDTVKKHQPDLVLVSCSSQENVPDTLALLERLREEKPKRNPYLVGLGGGCLEGLDTDFALAGADFLSGDLRKFANEILPNIERHGAVLAPNGVA